MADNKVNFTVVVDCIFRNKNNFASINDASKIDTFFIINRKFACKYPKFANSLNRKTDDEDKASAIDVIFNKSVNITDIPGWYWKSSVKKATEHKDFTKSEIELFMKYNPNLNQNDLEFMLKYFKDDVKNEIKLLKKFED